MSFINQVLFPKMEWFHKDNEKWEEEFCPLYETTFIPYQLESEVVFEDSQIITTIKGELQENYHLKSLFKGLVVVDDKNPFKSDLEFVYTTDRKTQQLISIDAELSIVYKGHLYQKNVVNIRKPQK